MLDTLVLNDCSIRDDWDHIRTFDRRKPLSETVRHLQLIMLQIIPSQMVTFLNLFKGLQVLEMDVCDLDLDSMKAVLLNQPLLHTFRCATWLHTSALNLANLQLSFRLGRDEFVFSLLYLFRNCSLQLNKQSLVFEEDFSVTMAANLLAEYADFASTLPIDHFNT